MKPAIKSQSIVPRLEGIAADLEKLRHLGQVPLKAFEADVDRFHLAQFHLRQALEGVFNIGSHILARLNGGRGKEYKEIAKLLGEKKVVDKNFAYKKLVKMAGYRNRLTHFYASITPKEMLQIIQDDLEDIEKFSKYIKAVLEHPEKLGLTVE